MSSTRFIQECPTCGRSLRIQVKYLGRRLTCQHCLGKLTAADPSAPHGVSTGNDSLALLRRADELLSSITEAESASTPG